MSVYILVVDDEPDVEALFRQQFRRDLRGGRFTMEFAPSAPAALARAADIATAAVVASTNLRREILIRNSNVSLLKGARQRGADIISIPRPRGFDGKRYRDRSPVGKSQGYGHYIARVNGPLRLHQHEVIAALGKMNGSLRLE